MSRGVVDVIGLMGSATACLCALMGISTWINRKKNRGEL